MKKILLPAVLMILFVVSAQSQIRFGAKGGVTTSSVSGKFDTKNVTNFSIGPTVEAMINQEFGAELSILYSQKGIKFEGQNKIKTSYIEVPLSLKFIIPVSDAIRPFVNAGPYVGFKISGDKNFSYISHEISEQWKTQGFTAGLNFGAGVEFFKFLQVGVNYGLGLTNNYKLSDGTYSVKDRTWALTVGVYF